jgi:type IV pilus assembly protein PilX
MHNADIRSTNFTAASKAQTGAVLIVSLVVLLVLTIVVMSANRGVVDQERMTAAIKETNFILQVAETAMIDAEAFVVGLDSATLAGFSDAGNNGLYSENNGPDDLTSSAVWANDKSVAVATVMPGYSARYIVESLGVINLLGEATNVSLENDYDQPDITPSANVFRIIVRATGPNDISGRIIAGYYSAYVLD